jgi:hypothetical protein
MSAQSDSATEYSKGPMIRAQFDVKKYRDNFDQIDWSKKPGQAGPVEGVQVPNPHISPDANTHDA